VVSFRPRGFSAGGNSGPIGGCADGVCSRKKSSRFIYVNPIRQARRPGLFRRAEHLHRVAQNCIAVSPTLQSGRDPDPRNSYELAWHAAISNLRYSQSCTLRYLTRFGFISGPLSCADGQTRSTLREHQHRAAQP